ncbi:hypothetical protein JTE90_027498, partial [Oedothorax gibbosus]
LQSSRLSLEFCYYHQDLHSVAAPGGLTPGTLQRRHHCDLLLTESGVISSTGEALP